MVPTSTDMHFHVHSAGISHALPACKLPLICHYSWKNPLIIIIRYSDVPCCGRTSSRTYSWDLKGRTRTLATQLFLKLTALSVNIYSVIHWQLYLKGTHAHQ